MDLHQILTPEEAAAWLKMQPRDLKKKSRTGDIPSFSVGHRTRRYHPATVIAKLAADAKVPPAIIATALSL